ncbi:flagellar motor protein MotB [Corallococcus sp. H22C18031201]|uniref:OmpA/MotB family protein n=1 Tax=Citreicoccus inhibens TaxID=2849499 RepID=UPI000E7293D2|nr:OmpA family protein [Citreicoccus inhibens]MBU8900147.1 OmpA family protein [Citreicoccus inhibens]RJS21787.1 flagellar motor protein MotB [Corallococcus sp. H22C18031201]
MDEARSNVARARRGWLPWGLLAIAALAAIAGAQVAGRSITALMARAAQLEHDAAESEARVSELRTLREAMERRLRVLERQQQAADLGSAAAALQAQGAEAQRVRREEVLASLGPVLEAERTAGTAFLELGGESLKVELSERLLFEPGATPLTPSGARLLARLAAVLAPLSDHRVEVADHTDESSHASPSTTSWELSAARAVAVVRALGASGAISPERLSATGQAAFRPVVPADSPQNRERNRRVELRVTPAPVAPEAVAAARTEPPPRPPARAPTRPKAKTKKVARR